MSGAVTSSRGAVVITGTSSGIGLDAAKRLIAEGFDVFGRVRSSQDADRVSELLGSLFKPLIFDVTDPDAIMEGAAEVRRQLKGRRLVGLVNNPAIDIGGPLALQPIDEVRGQYEVNVLGVVNTVQAFVPLLGADPRLEGPPGRIVNISSIGSKCAFPIMSGYCGTKFALEGMTESLRRELMLFGVKVVLVAPHAVLTPMLDKAETKGLSRYDHTPYQKSCALAMQAIVVEGRKGIRTDRVSAVILRALTVRKPAQRYRVERRPFMGWLLASVLPSGMVDKMMARQFALSQRTR